MSRGRVPLGGALVTGPETERAVLSLGVGISLAQTLACRAEEPVTFYVRAGDEVVALERGPDRVVTTWRLS